VLAHVAGIPVEEALMVAPALLAGVTMIIGYARVTAARITVKGHEPRGARTPEDRDAEVSVAQAPCAGARTSSTRSARQQLRHLPQPHAAPRTSPSATT
jgi:hypothetical protein